MLVSHLVSFPLPANLKLLKSNPSYNITRADKGRCIVILNKSDYVNNVLDHLNDNSTYVQINKDLNNSIQTKLNKLLSRLLNSGDIDINQSKSLKCYNGSSPYLYGLPKIHKSNIPIRPIINLLHPHCINFPNFFPIYLNRELLIPLLV